MYNIIYDGIVEGVGRGRCGAVLRSGEWDLVELLRVPWLRVLLEQLLVAASACCVSATGGSL